MKRALRGRLRILAVLVAFVALFLIARLYYVQIIQGTDFALRAERQYVSSSQQLYDRGSIYFTRKDGTLLSAAAIATGFLIAIDPQHLTNPESTYGAINALVPIDRNAFFTSAAKKTDPYEVIIHRASDSAGRAVSALDIPGVIVERERWRVYPAGTAAAQSIGLVAYDNDNSLAGRFGLEKYYDPVLNFQNEGLFSNFFAELFANLDSVIVDARETREGDVITTVDPVVEQELDKTLAHVESQYHSLETGGIIMDPSTGAIIALDVVPNFDPNHFSDANPETFANPLVESDYEFGSIMKPLTMASGIDARVITADTTYNDTGCIRVNASRICNYDLKARGVIPMQEVLSQSLNVGASFIATRLGHDKMRSYFTSLGFGVPTGADLPSEGHGIINNLNSPRDVEYDTASFGQGIAETPFEMIRALGALANHGSIVTPHLATAIRLRSGIVKKLSWGAPQQVFEPASVQTVTSMLVKVVDTKLGNGTVKIPSMSVAAKTGTAQIADHVNGGYYATRYFHSFFGYFPAYDPKYIILLYTREPQGVQYASETLTSPFMDLTHFLINYYNVPPDRASYAAAQPQ